MWLLALCLLPVEQRPYILVAPGETLHVEAVAGAGEPVALLWIVPLCVFLHAWVPALFFLIHLAMDYGVSYEKMPWYPYSPVVTQGFLVGVSDKAKEAVLIVVLVCMNLFLFLAPL